MPTADVPGAPAPPRLEGATPTSLTLVWDPPPSDGVWIDSHELHVVELVDHHLPGGTFDGARCRGSPVCHTAARAVQVAAATSQLYVPPPPPALAPPRAASGARGVFAATLAAAGVTPGRSRSGGWGALEDRRLGAKAHSLTAVAEPGTSPGCAAGGHDPGAAAFLAHCTKAPWVVRGDHVPRHNVHGLLPFTAYRVRLRVHSMVGWSEFSPPVEFVTLGG